MKLIERIAYDPVYYALRIIFWGIVLFVVLALFAPAHAADLVYREAQNSARLTNGPCVDPVLSMIPPPLRPGFRALVAEINGKRYTGCWLTVDDDVILVYDDGDMGRLSRSDFRDESI